MSAPQDNQKPKRKLPTRPHWWQKHVEVPLVLVLLLALGTGVATTLLLRPAPNPINQIIREVLNPTATYIPPGNWWNTTFISSLTSATPDVPPIYVDTVDASTRPCTELPITPSGKFVFRLWLQRSKELYRIDEDGTNLCHLTRDTFVDDQPAWSPDGQKIAFVSTREGYGIYIMNADGSDKTKLTDGGTAYSFPKWSPDGTQLIFQATLDEKFDLYAIDIDGTNLRDLTNEPRLDTAPAWSPDGQWIAFASDRTYNPFIPNRLEQSANYDIYMMTTDGLNMHRLTSNDVMDFYPSWSPDNQRIAFMSGFSNLYVMNRDGSDAQFLTNGEMPVWSADGQEIAFLRAGGLYKFNLSNPQIQKVSDINSIEYMDYWSGQK